MPQIIITAAARSGLERCRSFLKFRNPEAAKRAAEAIGRHLAILRQSPEIGRPHPANPVMREMLMPFGDAGYVALYVFDEVADTVIVLAFRHQKEAGY
jgi:plasmid stabilization system protein ParE